MSFTRLSNQFKIEVNEDLLISNDSGVSKIYSRKFKESEHGTIFHESIYPDNTTPTNDIEFAIGTNLTLTEMNNDSMFLRGKVNFNAGSALIFHHEKNCVLDTPQLTGQLN